MRAIERIEIEYPDGEILRLTGDDAATWDKWYRAISTFAEMNDVATHPSVDWERIEP